MTSTAWGADVSSLYGRVNAALSGVEEHPGPETVLNLKRECGVALMHLRATSQALERKMAAAARFGERVDRAQQVALSRAVTLTEQQAFDVNGAFVYVLRSKDDAVLYVGMSSNVLARLGAHMGNPQRRSHVARVQLFRCRDSREALRVEARMIREYRPPWNVRGIDAVAG